MLMAALATWFTLSLTFGDGAPWTVLKNRLMVSLMFLLPGVACVALKEPARELWLWIGELTRFSDDDYRRQAAQRIADFGWGAVATGLVLLLISVVLWLRQGGMRGTG